MNEKERCFSDAKSEIEVAWKECKNLEKRGVEFGKKCYEWQQKLREQGLSVGAIWGELEIPRQTAYRWINTYLEVEGLKPIDSERDRSKTNADIVNALSKRLQNARKAVERMTEDWQGWKDICPEETSELKKTIQEVGKFFTGLNL